MLKTFKTKVAGVTHQNPNGTDRQKILAKCDTGEIVRLVREPDNPYNEYAIAVFRKSGEQIGYIAQHVAKEHPALHGLADDMDDGYDVAALIVDLVGGSKRKETRGCILEVAIGPTPYDEIYFEASELLEKAKPQEKTDTDKAISLYREAIPLLLEIDQICAEACTDGKTRRHLRHPINRITLLLEKTKRYEECLDEIKKYEAIHDPVGLTKTDNESYEKRKMRVLKKFPDEVITEREPIPPKLTGEISVEKKPIPEDSLVGDVVAEKQIEKIEKTKQTFRLQVSGGEQLQKLYGKLKKGDPVELVKESEDRVSVFHTRKRFLGTKREYLGYLTKSADIVHQMERGAKVAAPQVEGFYREDWGNQLILQVTIEK
jgi:hypothetical protein